MERGEKADAGERVLRRKHWYLNRDGAIALLILGCSSLLSVFAFQ
jgi:hypothetical protein